MTIDALMEKAGCAVWPERWHKIYPRAMARFEKEGCIYATPGYYDALEAKYHSIGVELDVLKRGAEAVAKNDALLRLLALITEAMTDADKVYEDISRFQPPKPPLGADPFPYEILIGLATFSRMDYTYQKLCSQNLPMDKVETVLGYFCAGLRAHRGYHGREGYENYLWQQKIANGHVLPIGRFNIEISATMNGRACVFVNDRGEERVLADGIALHQSGFPLGSKNYESEEGSFYAEIIETPDAYIGYPYRADASVAAQKIALDKKEWQKKLSYGDPVIALHIPRNKKFTPDIVDASLKEAVEFLQANYPEEQCEVFRCCSWMCDPQLIDLLPETSNIAHFCKRFTPIAIKDDGRDTIRNVFHIDDEHPDYNTLPEDTSLFRILKEHYKSGKVIYDTVGYFFIK